MKKLLGMTALSTAVFIGGCCSTEANSTETKELNTATNTEISMNVASFNMAFCRNMKDYKTTWLPRRDLIMPLITFYDFDICGAQEPYRFQIDYLISQNREYAYIPEIKGNETPEDFKNHPEDRVDWKIMLSCMNNPIFYKKDRFEVLQSGRFWLSMTPEEPHTGRQWRHCTWAEFKEKNTGKTFYVFNTHLPTVQNAKEMEESAFCAKVLIYKMEEIVPEGSTVFIMGDFNAVENSDVLKRFYDCERISDARKISKQKPYGPNFTFGGYNPKLDQVNGGIIDYVFVSKNVKVEKFAVIGDHTGPVRPSDHLPIFAKVKF